MLAASKASLHSMHNYSKKDKTKKNHRMTARLLSLPGAAATLALILSATLLSCFVHARAVSDESGRGCVASDLPEGKLRRPHWTPLVMARRILLRMARSPVRQPDRPCHQA